MAESERNRVGEAAAIVAGWPRMWSALLVEHVEGADGRCRGCSNGVRAAPMWPCRLAILAETAQAINQRDAQISAPSRRA